MSLKQFGGVFGRNPTFNDVTIEGELILNGDTFTGLDYQGTWNASTNTPALTGGSGTTGEFYIVNVAGATDLDGITNWAVGDWAMFNGSAWQRLEGGANGNFVDLSASGNVTLGDASTDTVLVNGYVGVGGGATSSRAIQVSSSALTGTTQMGILSQPTANSAATSELRSIASYPVVADSAFTVPIVSAFYASVGSKGAAATATNWHGLYIADQTQGTNNYGITSLVSSGSNKWNIYASGTANNAFAGNVRIGSTTAPTNALDITGAMTVSGNVTLGDASTDTVTVNGYMGVGGISSFSKFNLEGVVQGTTTQIGIRAAPTFSSAATATAIGLILGPSTSAASYTVGDLSSLRIDNSILGAGSSITTQHGVKINDLTSGTNNYGITSLVSSGSNKWNIYASGTAANYFAGNVLVGTTTAYTWTNNFNPVIRLGAGAYVSGRAPSANYDEIYVGTNAYNDGAWKYGVDGFALQYYQDSGQHVFRNAASGTANAAITFNERFAINQGEAVFNDPGNDYDFRVESDTNTHALFVEGSSGNVGIGTSSPSEKLEVSGNIKTSGNLIVASGQGIDFSATSDAGGMTSELLDDYEEGTFTPVVEGTATAGTGTYSVQSGTYTKIGNTVTFGIHLAWSAHTGTGNIRINGLPFTVRNATNQTYAYSVLYSGFTVASGKQLTSYSTWNSTQVQLTASDPAGGGNAAIPIDTSVTYLHITGTYLV